MTSEELWHAIRAACQIMRDLGEDVDSVIVVGSQSILGSFSEDELPEVATLSREVDTLPNVADADRVVELSKLIEGICGEMSPFAEQNGFVVDGVDLTTCALADGWRDRLVPVSNRSTMGPSGRQFTGLCLDPADLCAAKLSAGREKDREFVFALFEGGLVDRDLVGERLRAIGGAHAEEATAALAEFYPVPQPELSVDVLPESGHAFVKPYRRRDGTWVSGYRNPKRR